MRRRTFLASTSALLAAPVVGRATAAEFGPIGRLPIERCKEAVVDTDTAYVAVTDGFATVDVSDPATPALLTERREILADRDGGPLEHIFDLDLDGDRLVVAGPAHGGGLRLRAIAVYDVADPADPELTGVYETDYPIHNVAATDGRAYLTANDGEGNALVVVDTDGTPAELGRWSLPDHDEAWAEVRPQLRVLHDVWVQDDRAYLAHWDAGTWIVDVSDPANPTAVSQVRGRSPETLASIDDAVDGRNEYVQTPGNDHYVTTNADATLLAVGAEAWDVNGDDHVGGPGDLELYDISTPTEPRRLSTIEAPPTDDPTRRGVWTTSHNFDLVDDRLYTSWYRGGVTVHDLSDPADPTELAAWADRDRAQFFTAKRANDRPFFVAPSMGARGPDSLEDVLYTFPTVDESGAPAIAPTTTSRTTVDSTTTTRDTTRTTTTTQDTARTTTTTTGQTTTAAAETTTTAAAGTTEPATDDGTTTASGSGPGFGPLATLAGLAAGGWYALRHREE